MPLTMMVNSSDCVNPARNGRIVSLCLPHENTGRHIERFRAARAHHFLHADREHLHDLLHDSEVVEDREERRNEDDDRQHLEGEDGGAKMLGWIDHIPHFGRVRLRAKNVAKNKHAASLRVTQHRGYANTGSLKDLSKRCFQHQDRKTKLQPHAPKQNTQLNGPPVAGQQPRY
jgi:hypothetical protein